MPEDVDATRGGRSVVALAWLVAGGLHLWTALDGSAGAGAAAVSATLAVVALIGSVALLVSGRAAVLLAAAVAGAVGVAAFFLPMVVPLPGFVPAIIEWADPWPFVAFLVDALVVRLAVFTLRRAGRPVR